MFKSILSVIALSTLTIAPASAELRRLSTDSYVAYDAQNRAHYIDYVRMDHEGDVQVKVTVNGNVVYYWLNCRQDRISVGAPRMRLVNLCTSVRIAKRRKTTAQQMAIHAWTSLIRFV